VRAEGWRWFGEWAINNAAVVGAFGTVGASVGLGAEAMKNTLGWTATGPMFGGGPMLDLMQSLDGMTYEMLTARPGQNTSEFFQNIENFIPGGALIKEIEKSAGKTVRFIPPSIRKSRTYAPPQSEAERAFRMVTGVQRRK
jgi:hypothetical protein